MKTFLVIGLGRFGTALAEELCALGGQAADLAGRLEQGLLVCAAIDREAGFLAGLSIGLELGRG